MKNISAVLTISALTLVLALNSGCQKWLTEKPKADFELESVTGQEGMDALLVGIYASMRPIYELANNLGVVGNDECWTTSNSNAHAMPVDRYIVTSSTKIVENAWVKHYKVIQNCNVLIDRAEKDPSLTDSQRNWFVGQGRFLRAFIYFRLVQWFGALPLITHETQSYDQVLLNTGRSDIKEVYKLIVSDLEAAAKPDVLEEEIKDGYATRYAAKALLAKVYLTMGTSKGRLEWNEDLLGANHPVLEQYRDLPLLAEEYYRLSYDLLKEIITSGKFDLIPNYIDLFSINPRQKNTNGESIWELQYSSQRGYGSQWSKTFGAKGNGAETNTYNAMAGTRIYTPVPSFWSYYKKGDLRWVWNLTERIIAYPGNDVEADPVLQQHFMTIDSDDPELLRPFFDGSENNGKFVANISCVKYRWGTGDPTYMWKETMTFSQDNCPTNVVVLRYADIILMFAEADMLLNGANPGDLSSTGVSQEAVDLVNEILYRARGNKTEEQMWDYKVGTWGFYANFDPYPLPVTSDNSGVNPYTGAGTPVSVPEEEKYRYMYDYTPQTLTFGELVKERARELCFEFHRWNDLSRWGLLEWAMDTRVDNLEIKPSIQPKHYLFPIPLTEWQASYNKEGMYQNPGY